MRTVLIVVAAMLIGPGVPNDTGGALATRAGQVGGSDVARDLAAGTLLVASRRLGDGRFVESVVLLFAHSKDGAAGLIINQRTTVAVSRVLPDLPIPRGPEPVVFIGGPVAPNEVRGLLRSPVVRADAFRVLRDVALLTSPAALEQAVAEGATAERLRLYSGYAGWGPGQLEREIQRGDWHVAAGDSAVVFSTEPETVWRRQILRTDVMAV